MRQKTRSLLAVALLLGLGVLVALYWAEDSSPVDFLRALHGEGAASHGS